MTTKHDDSDDVLRDALRDHMSPEAVAAIAALLQIAGNYETTENAQTMKQVYWFRELCADMTRGVDSGL